MAKGDETERKLTPADEISPLFTGGKADWIYSLTSLAAPHNGTTAYGLEEAYSENADTAAYDMFIDHAMEINKNMVTDVNTVSAKAPSDALSKEFDVNNIPAGVWNIMPVYLDDHMSLQGGFFKVNTDVERLYTEHFDMINRIA